MNSPIRLSRFARGDSRRIEVSFEFFPPNTEEMDKILWGRSNVSAAGANFVSVTYGAKAAPRASAPARRSNGFWRNAVDAGRSSHLRRCHARGHRQIHAPIIGWRPSHRGAAR
jgi:5,10-methylenetetrahydrofolate reductase